MKKLHIAYKKIGKLALLPVFAMGLILSSCEDEIIDLQPFNQISETVAFSTPEKVALSVLGMYQAAQIGEFGGRGYPFGAAFVQQGDCRGEDVVNIYAFYAFTYQGTYTPSTANNRYFWADTYRLINRVNIVAEGVIQAATDGVISQELANEYKGEALLMRAAAYHQLVFMFARPYKHTGDASHMGVPYHKLPFTTQENIDEGFATGRHSVAQVYQWILEDLDFAEQHLPLKSQRSGNTQVSRATKGAAAAYKARINLHMWNMQGVIAEGRKFFDGGVYAGHYVLNENPWDVFYNNYGSGEYMFGMESSATNYPSVNGALPQMFLRRLLVCISPILWRNEFWLSDDKRRDQEHMVNNVSGVMFTWKYKDDVNNDDISPMMRFAEVPLNLAEAYAREGNMEQALRFVNMVRDRALADPATQSYTAADFANTVELLEAILNERRIELVFEGHRFSEIHRLQDCPHFPMDGVPSKYDNTMPQAAHFELNGPYDGPRGISAIPYSDHRFVWPIPQVELDANPTLAAQQNPGW